MSPPKRQRRPRSDYLNRIIQGLPAHWEYPLLVIDRSYLPKCEVARLEIKDPDPEKVCGLIRQIAQALRPPEARWYVLPANPKKR